MIAKRIPRRQQTSSIARLVRYAVNAEGGLDPRSWSRTADYILDFNAEMNREGEKVSGVRVTNCGTDDPAAATLLIEATQAINTRSKKDKTYHLVFSFREGENPPQEVLHAIEDELCAAIGLADHQRISAVHVNTDHLHVHVAINKVHPTGFQNIEPFYDMQRLMEACERLEIEHGLERDHHGLKGAERQQRSQSSSRGQGETIGERAAAVEARSGLETLAGYVAREVAPAMRMATDWQGVHDALAEHGLCIKVRGAGLVIGDASRSVWVRASQCGREFSIKAMTDRLGPFVPPTGHASKAAPPKHSASRGYVLKPVHPHPSTAQLFAEYQRDRQTRLVERRTGLVRLREENASYIASLRQWKAAQHALLKASSRGVTRKVMATTLREQGRAAMTRQQQTMAQRRAALRKATATLGWADWLALQAERGNVEALAVLRSRVEREEKLRGDLLTAERAEHAKAVIFDSLKPVARRDGVVTYRTADGGMVVDRRRHVQAEKATAGAALVALSLAAERFAGQALVVEGTDAFKQDVARLAGLHRFDVTFKDAGMEEQRRAALLLPSSLVVKHPVIAKEGGKDRQQVRGHGHTPQNEL
ncbi:TraI/MobA(P) family conjugative relaxase [Xanthomonas massiliensis]|uniref:TraI/MobA(P) family conjugative relaxase n=1 Tax=Xanthomonas massiliensis TaxID=1720302 RepID=UPI00098EDF40|nr:TraI/MobA(P) family conjugative relaxase [Xanthomonas massiliensis]